MVKGVDYSRCCAPLLGSMLLGPNVPLLCVSVVPRYQLSPSPNHFPPLMGTALSGKFALTSRMGGGAQAMVDCQGDMEGRIFCIMWER